MSRLVLSLALAACVPAGPSGPAADPPPAAPTRDAAPGPTAVAGCLDLRGAPRRNLQRGPDGALWLEQWTRRPEPRGELVRVDPATGAESHVLSDILSAHLAGDRLVAVRPLGDDRSVIHGRRGLFLAALDGTGERPLSSPEHAITSYALARDAALYTTPDGGLYRRAFADERLDRVADGIAAVHTVWNDDLLVTRIDTPGLELLSLDGTIRPLDLAGDITSTSGHVLIDSSSGARALLDPTTTLRLPAGLRVLPGAAVLARSQGAAELLHGFDGRAVTALAAVTGPPVAEAVPVPGGIWALVRHDTDGDGVRRPLADEADLCLLARGSEAELPARDRPRRLDRPLASFAALADGDLSGATVSLEAGALVLRAPAAGPTTLAALRARAAALHRAAARLAGGPDLDLVLEWTGNRRHAYVSWDISLARPAIVAGGHGLAAPDAPVQLEHGLHLEPAADGRHRAICRGRARHDGERPRALALRCDAHLRAGDGAPLASAAVVLEDMPPRTDVPFALDLGLHELAPTVAAVRVFDGPRELPASVASADLDDYLAVLDRAAALGFSPAPGRDHSRPHLAAPPGFADLSARERAARAAALWDLLAAHAERHHHGRLPPVYLAGTAHTIRRGRLE